MQRWCSIPGLFVAGYIPTVEYFLDSAFVEVVCGLAFLAPLRATVQEGAFE